MNMLARLRIIFLLVLLGHYSLKAQKQDSDYAQELGYPKNAKRFIVHVDDALGVQKSPPYFPLFLTLALLVKANYWL